MKSVGSFLDANFLSHSDKIATLGEGTFGSVFLCTTPYGKYVIKETKYSEEGVGYPHDFINEVDLLLKFRAHPNVVTIQGVYFDLDHRKGQIILEPLDTNLSTWSRQNPFKRRIFHLKSLIKSIGSVLAIMNKYSFVHNDLKTNNILVLDRGRSVVFKLADFGSGCHVVNRNIDYNGIDRYCPPDDRDIFASECWAFMIVIVEMILGGKRMINHEDRNRFYEMWSTDAIVVKRSDDREQEHSISRFDLEGYLLSMLGNTQVDMLPYEFWDFVEPILNNRKCTMNKFIIIDTDIANEVDMCISKTVPVHPKFQLIESEIKERLKKIKLMRRFDKFSRLFNKFLDANAGSLNDKTIICYAEVALICIGGNIISDLHHFKDRKKFLLFQRAFLASMGYQVTIV